jgi:hypothetical protein
MIRSYKSTIYKELYIMRKTTYLLLAMTVFVVLFASACGGSTAPAAPAAQAAGSAPACQATSCTAPAVNDTDAANTFCVQKIPYQNISVMPGTTFESLDPKGELKCQDSGTVVNGKNVITCTGKQLWTYELKLTNSSCAANTLATGSGKCQDGSGYDAAQNCCAPLTTGGAGSVTIKVNIGACPLPK